MQRALISNLARPLMLVVLATSCTSDPTNSDNTPSALAVVSGSGQTGTVGSVLPTLIGVSVITANGTPVVGANVSFQVTIGTGSVSPASASTNAFGEATTQLTLGNTAGAVEVTVAVTGTTLTTKIPATASV